MAPYNVAMFYRRKSRPFEPSVHWVFAADIDARYDEMRSLGEQIVSHSKRSPGLCVNSQWKPLMATASIFTATRQALYKRPLQSRALQGVSRRLRRRRLFMRSQLNRKRWGQAPSFH